MQAAVTTLHGTFIQAGKGKQISLKDERDIVKETETEFRRRQGWKRIFPSIDYSYYKKFFVQERAANALLDARVMAKRRIMAENQALLARQQKQQTQNIAKK